MTASLRLGLIGYGYWGPNLARTIAQGERTELAAVCDLSPAARARAANRYPHLPTISDYRQLMEDKTIDGIVVALPMQLHASCALQALNHGKHVLVEKPLAMTVADCDELIAAAEERELTLMVGHTFIFNGGVRRAKEYLECGEIGNAYYVSMRRTNLGIVRNDGNAMWSLAPHDLSILKYWLGLEPLRVVATGAAHLQEGIEDVVFMSVTFDGGVVGHIHASWLEPHKIRDATIVGSQKMLVYDDTDPETKLRLYDKGIDKRVVEGAEATPTLGRYETFERFQMIARAGDVLLPKLELDEPLAQQLDHFARVIAGETELLADGYDGRWVVSILEAAQRSLERDGEPQPVKVAGRV